jgi:hypothetical protein
MLLKNAKDLLIRHGAKNKSRLPRPGTDLTRPFVFEMGDYVLEFSLIGWSERVCDILCYRRTDAETGQFLPVHTLGERIGNGTKIKRFIQEATKEKWYVGTVVMEYGPDATHPKLAASLRVRHMNGTCWQTFGDWFTLRTAEALAMAESTKDGKCPPEVLVDWLKDKGHLPQQV